MDGKLRKARKEYKCSVCGRLIRKGEVYFYERVAPWEHEDMDYFCTYRECPRCREGTAS